MEIQKKFYGIRWRMFFYIAGVIVGTLLLAAIAVNMVMRHQLKNQAVEKYNAAGEVLAGCVEDNFTKIEKETESFIFENVVQKSLENTALSYAEREKMSNVWNRISSKYMRNGVYLDNKGNIYHKGNKAYHFPEKEYKESPLYEAAENSYAKLTWVWMEDYIFGTGEKSVFLVRNVRNVYNPDQKGLLILQLTPYFMEESLKKAKASDELAYYVFDCKGELCYEKMEEDIRGCKKSVIQSALNLKNKTETQIKETAEGILLAHYEENSGVTIVTFVSNWIIYRAARTIGKILLVLLGILLIFASGFSLITAYFFTKPIYEISKTMEAFDGTRFDNILEINTKTELDNIGDAYNRMLNKMQQLVGEIQMKEREVFSLELDSLYYQLNPHFLYNTLDTIYLMARIEKQKDIMDVTHALSTLLKISLNKGSGTVTVEQELEHVKSYLEIQKIRFGDNFRYQVHCDEEIRQLKMIKLILQPVVENSVKYGFSGIKETGVLLIYVKEENGRICFSVYNNGNSILKEKVEVLNRIREMEQEEMKKYFFTERGGFGIYNIVTRMKMKYGNKFDIQYSIPEDGGTLCCIWIPKNL